MEQCNEHLTCVFDPIKLLTEKQLDKLKELLGVTEYGVLVPENYKLAMKLARDWFDKELQGTGWTVSEPDIYRIFVQVNEATSDIEK